MRIRILRCLETGIMTVWVCKNPPPPTPVQPFFNTRKILVDTDFEDSIIVNLSGFIGSHIEIIKSTEKIKKEGDEK